MKNASPEQTRREIRQAADALREFEMLSGLLEAWDAAALDKLVNAAPDDHETRRQAQVMANMGQEFRRKFMEWQNTGKLARLDQAKRKRREGNTPAA